MRKPSGLRFSGILIPLWIFAPHAPSKEVWTGFEQEMGWPNMGIACLVGLTTPIYALIGPDAAVHMCKCGLRRWMNLS